MLGLQDLWQALPVVLAPVLGNPLLLAGFGINPRASIASQVGCPLQDI